MDAVNINELLKNPATWLIIAWIFREFWAWLKDNNRHHDEVLKQNTNEVCKLTVQLVRLETKLEAVDKLSTSIPKIQSDINVLHSRVRALMAKEAN